MNEEKDSEFDIKPITDEELIGLNSLNDDDDEDEFENSNEIIGSNYAVPESKDQYIDPSKGTLLTKDQLTPYHMIKAIADTTGTVIRQPLKGCGKCYGRGYIGKDVETEMPIPCNCIYPPKTDVQKMNENIYDAQRLNGKMNRNQKRKMKQVYKKQLMKRKQQNIQKKEDIEDVIN